MISTALPPASARPAKARAMFPGPIMLMLLIGVPAFRALVLLSNSSVEFLGRIRGSNSGVLKRLFSGCHRV
jgi:hypothetical protein